MPEELRGPVPYTLYVNDMPGSVRGVSFEPSVPEEGQFYDIGHAALADPNTGSNEEADHFNARLTFQELYWHRVGTHPNHDIDLIEDGKLDPPQVEPPNGTPTLTTNSPDKSDFLPSEWRHVIRGMNTRFRTFYQTPFHKDRNHHYDNEKNLFDPKN
jgi:hypothetical protein